MTERSRSQLEADLIRYQHSENFASQAETLMALGDIAIKEEEHNLAQGFYGQAWGAYEQIDDKSGCIKAIWFLTLSMRAHVSYNRFERLPQIFNGWEIMRLENWALSLCNDITDLRSRANTYKFMGIRYTSTQTNFSWIALHRALHCYEALNDDLEQLEVLMVMCPSIGIDRPEYGQYMGQVLQIYRRLNNKSGEAHALYALGHHKKWHDLTAASEFLKTAQQHFIQLQEYKYMVKCMFEINIFALRQSGYEIYLKQQLKSIAQVFQIPSARPYLLPLWRSLAKIARQRKDLDTARLAFQRAITCSVGAGQSQKQGELYWQWGFMEYRDAGHHSMGFGLCRWAITLIRIANPQTTEHQRQFKSLCREMKRGMHKSHD